MITSKLNLNFSSMWSSETLVSPKLGNFSEQPTFKNGSPPKGKSQFKRQVDSNDCKNDQIKQIWSRFRIENIPVDDEPSARRPPAPKCPVFILEATLPTSKTKARRGKHGKKKTWEKTFHRHVESWGVFTVKTSLPKVFRWKSDLSPFADPSKQNQPNWLNRSMIRNLLNAPLQWTKKKSEKWQINFRAGHARIRKRRWKKLRLGTSESFN